MTGGGMETAGADLKMMSRAGKSTINQYLAFSNQKAPAEKGNSTSSGPTTEDLIVNLLAQVDNPSLDQNNTAALNNQMKNKIAKEMEVIAHKTYIDGLSLSKRLIREK